MLVAPVLATEATDAVVTRPEQGVNNRSYVVTPASGSSVVLKARPRPRQNVRNSPQWPRYTQQLFGTVSNGAISTLADVSADLARHGALRTPAVLLVDESLELVGVPYYVAEFLSGRPFGWDDPLPPPAVRQLATHLGSLHRATFGDGFGIYSRRGEFSTGEWWDRFARAYATLVDELARGSDDVRSVRVALRLALERAVAAGPPGGTVLVSVDQSPTHYLGTGDGTISGVVDVEGHLWAPREYELAVTELWIRDLAAFRTAYEEHLPWPERLEETRRAYHAFTWMEWIYCLHTLLHDHDGATRLELALRRLCEDWSRSG